MGKKTTATFPLDDTIEFTQPEEPLRIEPSSAGPRRGRKALLAAGAVASTVAATAAYRRSAKHA